MRGEKYGLPRPDLFYGAAQSKYRLLSSLMVVRASPECLVIRKQLRRKLLCAYNPAETIQLDERSVHLWRDTNSLEFLVLLCNVKINRNCAIIATTTDAFDQLLFLTTIILKENNMRATTAVELDPQTDAMLKSLMDPLRETSKEGVIRKAVALMKQVVEMARDDRYFILETSKGDKTRIWLD